MTIAEKLLKGESLRAEEIKTIMEKPNTPEIVQYTLIDANACYKVYDIVVVVKDTTGKSRYFRFSINELHDGTISYYRQKCIECLAYVATTYCPIIEE